MLTPLEQAIKAEQDYRRDNRLAPFAERPSVGALEAISGPLNYVHNVAGRANLEDFKADHAPIGSQLWISMHSMGLVRVDLETARIILTPVGVLYHAELYDSPVRAYS